MFKLICVKIYIFYLKTVSITTDNEATVKKACSKLTSNCVGLSCMGHNINLAVQNGLKIWDKTNK